MQRQESHDYFEISRVDCIFGNAFSRSVMHCDALKDRGYLKLFEKGQI